MEGSTNSVQRDRNILIPKRTLVRLKKQLANASTPTNLSIHILDDEQKLQTSGCDLYTAANVPKQEIEQEINLSEQEINLSEQEIDFLEQEMELSEQEIPISGQNIDLPNQEVDYEQVSDEVFHCVEDDDCRDDIKGTFCVESSSDMSDCEDDTEPDIFNGSNNSSNPVYPGANMTVEESVLSIMKYSLKHKTTYAALSDLLELISLHLPYESNKEHLKSLYFLKKAFAASKDEDDIVSPVYYCQTCFAGPLQSGEQVCRFCEESVLRGRNYFLSLDIASQLKDV